jgi:hypothetical protein
VRQIGAARANEISRPAVVVAGRQSMLCARLTPAPNSIAIAARGMVEHDAQNASP